MAADGGGAGFCGYEADVVAWSGFAEGEEDSVCLFVGGGVLVGVLVGGERLGGEGKGGERVREGTRAERREAGIYKKAEHMSDLPIYNDEACDVGRSVQMRV